VLETGYAAIAFEYDNSDNVISESYFNEEGERTWCSYGYSEIIYTYDDRNHCIEEHLLNTDGEPAIHIDDQYSWLHREVDPDGRVLSIRYFDTLGVTTFFSGQYAQARYTYDLAGRETSVSYYDRGEHLCVCQRGYAIKKTVYNEFGNVTQESYYDTRENLTDTTSGYATVLYTYDDLGNLTSKRYLNTMEQSVIPEDVRYAAVLNDFDDVGRLISEEYLDEEDMPVNCREGFALHKISYSESGLIEEEYYEDAFGRPAVIEAGYSRRKLVSEDEESHTYVMKVMNETVDEGEGWAWSLQTYDRYENPIEIRWYDADDNPVNGPEGCHMTVMEYTSRKEVSLIHYFDDEEKPTAVEGVYGIRNDYDGYGNIERKTWLGQRDLPVDSGSGYAQICYEYDLSSLEQVEQYYEYYRDEEGAPTQADNGAWGRSTLYYPVTGTYDITYTDQAGNPILTTDGYAVYEYIIDENDNVTRERYLDELGAAVNCSGGYSSIEYGYDEDGRMISERCLDRYNKLVNNEYGVAGWNGYYDESGDLVISNMFDQDRKSVDPDNWDPLSAQRFEGQIRSVSEDEADETTVADVIDVTNMTVTDEVYQLVDGLEPDEAA